MSIDKFRSQHSSAESNKTAERIFPASSTAVKSVGAEPALNPFDKLYGARPSNKAVQADTSQHSISAKAVKSHDRNTRVKPQIATGTDEQILYTRSDSDSDAKAFAVGVEEPAIYRVSNSQHDAADSEPSEVLLDRDSIKASEAHGDAMFTTQRFEHKVNSDGVNQVLTGLDGHEIQACEDEQIHFPGAVQSFGVLLTLLQTAPRIFEVQHVSENSFALLGLTPKYLFGLESFLQILPEHEQEIFLNQLEFLEDSNSSDGNINSQNTSSQDVEANVSPEVFILSGRPEDPDAEMWKCWTALHRTNANGDLIILEFEIQKDLKNPLTFNKPVAVPKEDDAIGADQQTLRDKAGMSGDGFGAFSEEDLLESTRSMAKPIRRVRRSVLEGDDKGTVEIFAILSQVNEQLSAPTDLKSFLKVVVGLIKDITSFHRVMVYQFDEQWNGQVVAELVDWSQTKDLFMGLFFPATDIPAQARSMYKLNKTRVLYDREQVSSRLVCRSKKILDKPLDMTHCFLRAMSPIHLKYLANMGVRASMSISIVAFGELWGLIACHTYGNTSMRCSFLVRKLCRLVGEQISHNVERLSYTSRLAARKMVYSASGPALPGSSTATLLSKAEDLLALFEADAGMLSVGDEGKILGHLENSREAITLREYFRHKRFELITSSTDLASDFPDINYVSSSPFIVGVLYIPLSSTGEEFMLFFRRGQLKKVHWAGNPYEKILEKNKQYQGVLLPRESFRTWSETVIGRCKAWTEEQIETAAVLCLVYSKFIGVWRERQEVLQTSRLASILLTNVGHEVRTPLNAVINYLEIAMEGKLSPETRENLEKSHSASKSLVYVINDLLDLTKLEHGQTLFKNESFDLLSTIREAVSVYRSQAERHAVHLELVEDPTMPRRVLGDQAKMRQIISNVTANALKHTKQGAVTVHTKVIAVNAADGVVEAAIEIRDTGCGMSEEKLDALFDNFELVEHSETSRDGDGSANSNRAGAGLGLAIVARVVRNMNGQLRAESRVGRGSVFTFVFNFRVPEDIIRHSGPAASQHESNTLTKQLDTTPNDSRNIISTQRTVKVTPEILLEAAKSSQNSEQLSLQDLKLAEVNDKAEATSDKSQKAKDDSPHLIAQSMNISNVGRSTTGQHFWPSNEEHARSMNKLLSVGRRSSNGSVSGSIASVKDYMDRQSSGGSKIDHLVSSLLGSSGGSGPQVSSQDARESVYRGIEAGHVPGLSASALDSDRALPNLNQSSKAAQTGANTSQPSEFAAAKHVSSESIQATTQSANENDAARGTIRERTDSPRPRYSQPGSTVMKAVKLDSDDVSVPQRSQPGSLHGSTSGDAINPVGPPNLNVLYAEDDAINRSIVQKRLRMDKHSVHLAHDGLDCYDEFAKDTKKYDVILMDMQMPILDGMAATRKIRQLEETCYAERKSRIPIIAVSASLTEGQAHDAIATGLDGWILKPVDFRRLRHLFSGLCDTDVRKQDFYETGKDYAWTRGGWLTLDVANKIGV